MKSMSIRTEDINYWEELLFSNERARICNYKEEINKTLGSVDDTQYFDEENKLPKSVLCLDILLFLKHHRENDEFTNLNYIITLLNSPGHVKTKSYSVEKNCEIVKICLSLCRQGILDLIKNDETILKYEFRINKEYIELAQCWIDNNSEEYERMYKKIKSDEKVLKSNYQCPIPGCVGKTYSSCSSNNGIIGPGHHSKVEYYYCDECSVMFRDPQKFSHKVT